MLTKFPTFQAVFGRLKYLFHMVFHSFLELYNSGREDIYNSIRVRSDVVCHWAGWELYLSYIQTGECFQIYALVETFCEYEYNQGQSVQIPLLLLFTVLQVTCFKCFTCEPLDWTPLSIKKGKERETKNLEKSLES